MTCPLSRRRALAVMGAAATAAGCSDPPSACDGGSFTNACPGAADGGVDYTADITTCGSDDSGVVALVSEVPVGCFRPVRRSRPSVRAILARDERGLYALKIECTHTGCILPMPTMGCAGPRFRCLCHFSEFDLDGRVQPRSVATRSLPNYRVTVCEGKIYINPREEVPVGTRVAVPGG